jgi:predicted permease
VSAVSWTIELSPAAARALRDLALPERRRIAERIGHLQANGLPPSEGADPTAWVAVPAGDHRLLCVQRDVGSRAIVIAVIEPIAMNASEVLLGLARIPVAPVTNLLRRATGADDELNRNASAAAAGLPTLRVPTTRVKAMDLLHEVRYAARSLWRYPTIVVLAVAALALGVGLPSAMYSLMQGAILRGLPVPDPQRIIHIERRPLGRTGEGWQTAARDWEQWTAQQTSFDQIAAYTQSTVALRTGESTDRYDAARVSANTFGLLGVRPAAGRFIAPGDDQPGAEPVVVLGHAIWRDRFGSSPDALGQTVFANGNPYTIVGVAPEGFEFPFGEDVWLPLVIPVGAAQAEDFPLMDVIGRLKSDVRLSAARSEFDVIASRVAGLYPETNATMGIALKPFTERYTGESATRTTYVVLGIVLLVLLVACANVANLLLVRAVHGLRDLAVRRALGASRGRILRQLFVESTVLCVVGGVVGIGVAWCRWRMRRSWRRCGT